MQLQGVRGLSGWPRLASGLLCPAVMKREAWEVLCLFCVSACIEFPICRVDSRSFPRPVMVFS